MAVRRVVVLESGVLVRGVAHIEEAVFRLWASGLDSVASVKGPSRSATRFSRPFGAERGAGGPTSCRARCP